MKTKNRRFYIIFLSIVIAAIAVVLYLYNECTGIKIVDSTDRGFVLFQRTTQRASAELKSSVVELSGLEIIGKAKLSQLECRRVIPSTFNGYYGWDYIEFKTDIASQSTIQTLWRKEKTFREPVECGRTSFPGKSEYPPKWWPATYEATLLGCVQKKMPMTLVDVYIGVWMNKKTGSYYVFYPWGH